MKKILTPYLLLAVVFLYGQEAEPFELEKIRNNVYILYGGMGNGSNVGILNGDQGILLVDAMMAKASVTLEKKIKSISSKPVKYIINTHGDIDHMGGNDYFGGKGARSILNENVVYEGRTADQYFSDAMKLEFGGEEVELYHVESHAFSDALIFFRKSNVLFMGDTFTNSWYATFNAGGLQAQLATIELALKLADENTIVVPGHGILTDRSGLMKYADAAQNWVSRMAELYKNGSSIQEMQQDRYLQEYLNDFIDARLNKQIPLSNARRFIERTISIDLTPRYPMSTENLNKYVGQYGNENTETVAFQGEKLVLRMNNPQTDIYELLPLSKTEFHPRGSLDMTVSFKLNESGRPIEMTYITNGQTLSFPVK